MGQVAALEQNPHDRRMKKATSGHGSLWQNGAVTDLSMVATAACPVEERGIHKVRLVMAALLPGGCEMEVTLSPEEAAHLASSLYALARTAIIMNERETISESMAPVLQAAA